MNDLKDEVSKSLSNDINDIKGDMETNKSLGDINERKVDAIMKMGEGITHEFTSDESMGYEKEIPSGASLTSIKKFGGRSIVWNQITEPFTNKTFSICGITFTINDDGSINLHGTVSSTPSYNILALSRLNYIKRDGRQYLYRFSKPAPDGLKYGASGFNVFDTKSFIFSHNDKKEDFNARPFLFVSEGDVINIDNLRVEVFDLTQMFGKGNEPTIEEFNSMFPNIFYPYSNYSIMNIPINKITKRGVNLITPNDIVPIKSTAYGVTFESVEGYIYAHGKGTDNHYCTANNVELIDRLNIGDKYYLCNYMPVNTSGEVNAGISIRYYKDSDKFYTNSVTVDNSITSLKCYIQSSNKFNGIKKIYPCFSKSTTYVKYNEEANGEYEIPESIQNLKGYGLSLYNGLTNEVDLVNKTYTQNVSSYTITGDEKFTNWSTTNTEDGTQQLIGAILDFDKIPNCDLYDNVTTYNTDKFMCDKLQIGTNQAINSVGNISFRCINDGIHRAYIPFINSSMTTTSEIVNWLKTNKPTIIYKLENPVVTDISDLIPEGFLESLEVEGNGSLLFMNKNGNDYRVPVKSSEEYVVKLSDVTNS